MSCALGNIQAKKRLFISLLIVSLIALSVIFFGIWKISYLGLQSIHEFLPAAFGAFVPFFIVQALTSGSPAVKNDINPNKS